MDVSYSDIAAWNRCRFLYHATRVRKWQSKDNQPKTIGDLVHVGICAHHLGANPNHHMDQRFMEHYSSSQDLDKEDLELSLNTAKQIVPKAVANLSSQFATYIDRNTPLVEYKFSVPLADDITFNGVVDWVAMDKDSGQVWLFDYKTRSSIEQEITEDYNLQMAIYQYILRNYMGVEVIGSICYQIRSAAMAKPKLNKDGTMSRADIICDWPTYRQALMENDLDPGDYLDMRAKLQAKTFFQMSRSYRSPDLLDSIWQNCVVPVLGEMRQAYSRDLISPAVYPRNMNSQCKLCSIVDRCQNDLRGLEGDYEIVFEG